MWRRSGPRSSLHGNIPGRAETGRALWGLAFMGNRVLWGTGGGSFVAGVVVNEATLSGMALEALPECVLLNWGVGGCQLG